MDDDELLRALGRSLEDPVPPPPAERLGALRDAVDAARPAGGPPLGVGPAHGGAPLDDEEEDDAPVVPLRSRRRAAWMLAAAAVLAVVLLAVGLLRGAGTDDGSVEYAGPIRGPGATGELVVTKTGIGRVVEVTTDELPILPTGEFYEVWFVGPGDSPGSPNRISAGTFHPDPDGRSAVTLAAAVDPALKPVVQITAEPGDGDPAPSGPVVLEVDTGG